MSKKSWWMMFVAALSLTPLAACDAPGTEQPGEEPESTTETEPATGTDVGGTETDPATGGEI